MHPIRSTGWHLLIVHILSLFANFLSPRPSQLSSRVRIVFTIELSLRYLFFNKTEDESKYENSFGHPSRNGFCLLGMNIISLLVLLVWWWMILLTLLSSFNGCWLVGLVDGAISDWQRNELNFFRSSSSS